MDRSYKHRYAVTLAARSWQALPINPHQARTNRPISPPASLGVLQRNAFHVSTLG